ncbi:hypothetical protein [Methylomagnum ishizawai]|uniref:hypothetical protein n=1 Tax=Methylomagnum ishizawai TaxID=1760988 RepID=UPI001C32A783|nr:hypothetical protein [Methylomagnum ishizawai]BBL74399.1 hypothetical protein MishRS11D_14970 [Methylomagnum ishizawai]
MNEQFSNIIAGLTATLAIAWFGFEISRKRKRLRETYDVLDKDDRHICIALEQMVEDGKLKPWTPGSSLP